MFNSILLSVSADPKFYEEWSDVFKNKGIFADGFRTFLWGLVKVFAFICDACEKLLVMANKAISFIFSDKVVQFISQWRFVIIGVLIIAVLFFGITMIVNSKQDRSKLLQNMVIAACVLIGLSSFIPTLGKNTAKWSKDLISTNSSSSAEIIKGAVTDLYYLDANNFSKKAATTKNNISSKRIMNIDPTEDITSSDDVSNPKIFSYSLSYDKNGKPILNEIDDSGFSWNNDTYYRYSIDFTTIYITLFATAIVMIFTAFKVVKIVFDIIVHQILAVILAAGDWASGQKLKEVIKSLFALFFSVFMCSVMMKLYFLFSAWTSSNIESGIARALLLVFAAFAVIDGPNIVEKIFGIDAGLASTFRSVSTLFFATSGLTRLAKGTVHGASSLVRGVAHGSAGAGGFVRGLSTSIKNAGNSSSENNQNIADSAADKNNYSNPADKSSDNNKNQATSTLNSKNPKEQGNSHINSNSNITNNQNTSSEPEGENHKSIANTASENGGTEKNSGIADAAAQNNPEIANSSTQKNISSTSEQTDSEKKSNIADKDKLPEASDHNGSDGNRSIANASSEQSKTDKSSNIPETRNQPEKSVSNSANNKSQTNNYDFIENKARNPRSVIGAGARGYKNGQYFGEKIGNAATKIARKRNARGDE